MGVGLPVKVRLVQLTIRGDEENPLRIEVSLYYFYNEDTSHHYHTWMVPRCDWMYEFGRLIESVRPVLLHARNKMNTNENTQGVLAAIGSLRKELNK